MNLQDYIINHVYRGECQCGKCFDKGNKPDPIGHTIDIFFFKIAIINKPTINEFKKLISQHKGIYCECDPLDGNEHNYIELGGWIGDQGLALCFMGLCTLLNLTNLNTPKVLKLNNPELENRMAGMGFISIQGK